MRTQRRSADSAEPSGRRAPAQVVACLVALFAAGSSAQCLGWPAGCPTMEDLAVSDRDNTPTAIHPGHTPELTICPPSVNENKRLQLDLTDTFTALVGGYLCLHSFYNHNSAASTTSQFWFFDIDQDAATGGSDSVPPSYRTFGPTSDRGPVPCDTPDCSLSFLAPVHSTGFEYYINSFGSGAKDFAIFEWDGLSWVELPPPAGAENLQGAEDNPANPYSAKNGFRGVAGVPASLLGLGSRPYDLFARSHSCEVCCGDEMGGEGEVFPPGIRKCLVSLCGDCDGDYFVTILDAALAAMYSAGLATLSEEQFSNCNVAGELDPSFTSDVTVHDALVIARYVVGLGPLICCVP